MRAEGLDARRRDAGDVVTSSRSANNADGSSPPRPFGLRPAGPLAALLAPYIPQRVCSSLAPCQRAWGPQQSVHVILRRALSAEGLIYPAPDLVRGFVACPDAVFGLFLRFQSMGRAQSATGIKTGSADNVTSSAGDRITYKFSIPFEPGKDFQFEYTN